MRDEGLWQRLREVDFESGDSMAGFSAKLAKEEGWRPSYVADVLEEYRRFLYLTQVSETQTTPSRAIDRAWHLHLIHSRDYWDRLCGSVLGKPLHHDPGSGLDDKTHFGAHYALTRALYAEEFGHPPPAKVWYSPTSAAISKWAGLAFLLGLGMVLLGAFSDAVGSSYVGWGLAIMFAGGVVMLSYADPGRRRSRSGSGGSGCGGGGGE